MVNLNTLREAARIVQDENGEPVVQIPLGVWEMEVGKLEPEQPSQAERILALLKEWENEPDDTPEEWKDDFLDFIQKNRLDFGNRELGLGDE